MPMKTITHVDSTRPNLPPIITMLPRSIRMIQLMHIVAMRLIFTLPVAIVRIIRANVILITIPWIALVTKIRRRWSQHQLS